MRPDRAELLTLVARRHEGRPGPTGLPHPSWPNPHPEPWIVADEEYSRLTDPFRYRIALDRSRAWTDVLSEVDGVTVAPVGAGSLPTSGNVAPLVGGWRLECDRAGTAPVFVLEYDLPDAELVRQSTVPFVSLVAGRVDASPIEVLPDCGCDACDCGSEALLESVDDAFLTLITGPVVVLRHPEWEAYATGRGHGCSSTGPNAVAPDLGTVETWCRAALLGHLDVLPQGTEVVAAGSPWGIVH